MIAFIAFFGTILFCAIRDGTKKRRQKERKNAAIQAQAQAVRQKELERREKFRVQIERENARRKALETRDREKREKAERAREIAQYRIEDLRGMRKQLQAHAARVERAMEDTRKTEKELQYSRELVNIAARLQKIDLELAKLLQL